MTGHSGCSSRRTRLHRRSARSADNIANTPADRTALARRHRQPHSGHGGRLHDGSVVRLGGKSSMGQDSTSRADGRLGGQAGHRHQPPCACCIAEAVRTTLALFESVAAASEGCRANRPRHRARALEMMASWRCRRSKAAFHAGLPRSRCYCVERGCLDRTQRIVPRREGSIASPRAPVEAARLTSRARARQ